LDAFDADVQREAVNLAEEGKLWPGAVGVVEVAGEGDDDPGKVELDSDDDVQLDTIRQRMQELQNHADTLAAAREQGRGEQGQGGQGEGGQGEGGTGAQLAAPTAIRTAKHAVHDAAIAASRAAIAAAKQSMEQQRASSSNSAGRGRGRGTGRGRGRGRGGRGRSSQSKQVSEGEEEDNSSSSSGEDADEEADSDEEPASEDVTDGDGTEDEEGSDVQSLQTVALGRVTRARARAAAGPSNS
jgi:hypothetical protein